VRFGVHVGIGGGFAKSVAEALAAKCECIQLFAGNPRGWRTTPYNPSAWQEFARLRKAHDIRPAVIHTSYLINLASADTRLRNKSAALIAHDLAVAAKGEIEYVNTHLGSYGEQARTKGFAKVCSTLIGLIKKAPSGPMLLLENSASGGNRCAGSLEELGKFLRAIGRRRVGVCLDTAHLWASGYEIATKKGVERMLAAADKYIGLDKIRVLHINDTCVALGARHDAHWHVAKGNIGAAGFRALFACRGLAHAACICETPKTPELDAANVRTAKRLAGRRRSAIGTTPKLTKALTATFNRAIR